jgi:protein phosphatase inhibitor 2
MNGDADKDAHAAVDNDNDDIDQDGAVAFVPAVPLPPATAVKPALKRKDQQQQHQDTAAHDGAESEPSESHLGSASAMDATVEKKRLKWDEEVIEEHDLLRGTRIKIDEPNTPFAQYDSGAESDGSYRSQRSKSPSGGSVLKVSSMLSGSGDGDNSIGSGGAARKADHAQQHLSWDLLQSRLDTVAAVRDAYPSSPSSHGGGTIMSGVEENEGDDEGAGDEATRRRNDMKKLEFQEHRRRHYNEMEAVRKFQMEHPSEDLTDDEDMGEH